MCPGRLIKFPLERVYLFYWPHSIILMSVFCLIYLADGENHIVGGVYFTTVEKANQAKDTVSNWAYLHPLDCQVENIAQWAYHKSHTPDEIVESLVLGDDMTTEDLRKYVYPERC